jgi:hypothetical protein
MTTPGKTETSFSEEKEAKRLLSIGVPMPAVRAPVDKSFLVLFSKKEHSLPC